MGRNRLLLTIIFVVSLGIVVTYLYQKNDQQVGPNIKQNGNKNYDTTLIDELKKQFPHKMVWNKTNRVSITYRSYDKDYNLNEIPLSVYQTTGTGMINADVKLESFPEENLMLQSGWIVDNNQAADGPGKSMWGYVKENNNKKQVLLLSYENHTISQQGPMNVVCPCNISYTISLSDPF